MSNLPTTIFHLHTHLWCPFALKTLLNLLVKPILDSFTSRVKKLCFKPPLCAPPNPDEHLD
jgi:hypothetical protein